jgi:hypothetical protein
MRIDERIGRLTLNTFGLLGPPVHAVFPVGLRAAYFSARDHASGDEGGRLYNCEHLPSVVPPRDCITVSISCDTLGGIF